MGTGLFLRRGRAAAWMALLWLAALGGCGPGVGGSGTGASIDPPGATMPAALAALCVSDLSPLLRCPVNGSSTVTALGTALTWLADGSDTRNALARVEGNAVDFEVACAGLQFSGNWGQVAGQPPAFHGVVRNAATGAAQSASLIALRQGTAAVLQLFDADGRALASPITLTVVPGAPPVGICR